MQIYSVRKFDSQIEKRLFREILIRAAKFVKKDEERILLGEMLPNYEENSLKLLAIQLFAKNLSL